ncbi:LPP20 family lipoprotein [Celerinatantimonas sp. MCCC 1A17872]|uniref:LPP20 family lipoprotein n=1 Tax=Celerinatantimonas sp. MCCC 1A17872 TaxID=3177514 RepID=UPI0038BFAFE4
MIFASNKWYLYLLVVFMVSGCSSLSDLKLPTLHRQDTVTKKPPQSFAVIRAVGYAPIQEQMGPSEQVKELQAMRASKLDAYRELSERVYGQKVASNVTVKDMILGNQSLEASVYGVIRGARVLKSYRVKNTYVTELELDFREVYRVAMSMQPTIDADTSYLGSAEP